MKRSGCLQTVSMTKVDLGGWIAEKRARLHGKTEFPSIEINAIASHILQRPTSWIVSHPETPLNGEQVRALDESIQRLLTGEPLAYITGVRSFFGLDFFVNQNVLIPRPETELLVEQAKSWLEVHAGRRTVADIGTGSGIIAISLAHIYPDLRVTAFDISTSALEVARQNACFHNVEGRIQFIQSDLLDGISAKYDLILANLPYIPTKNLNSLSIRKFEPLVALDGGKDGLRLLTKLINTIPANITPGGCIILEIQYNQSEAIKEIAARQFPKATITVHEDLASLPRVMKIRLEESTSHANHHPAR